MVFGAGAWCHWRLRRRRRELERTVASLTADVETLQGQLEERRTSDKVWTRLAEQRIEERVAERRADYERRVKEIERLRLRLRGLAHDIRNPLVAVRFISDEVFHEVVEESVRERVADQRAAVDRCADLISQMVRTMTSTSAEEKESSQPVFHRVELFADFVRARLRELSGHEAAASVSMSPHTPSGAVTQARLLERVLDNLLSNAFEHAGGRDITVDFDGNPQEMVIRVSDGGPGLPADQLEALVTGEARLMERSRGIGLSVVVNLIEELGGQLEVYAAPSAGTSFWVRVPVQPRSEAQDRDTSARRMASRVHLRSAPDWVSPAS